MAQNDWLQDKYDNYSQVKPGIFLQNKILKDISFEIFGENIFIKEKPNENLPN